MKILMVWAISMLSCLGQNFAVLLAKDDTSAPSGFPTNWPSQVQPIGNAKELPAKFPPPWRFATEVQVQRWMADHTAEKAIWDAAQEAIATQPKRDRQALVRLALAELKNLKTSTGPLTNDQRDRALRRFAEILEAIIEEMNP